MKPKLSEQKYYDQAAGLLDYYQIDDPSAQIKNYLDTYGDKIKNRLYPGEGDTVYIGEEKGHLGDNVTYTRLPRALQHHRSRKTIVYPNRYAQALFGNNPFCEVKELADTKPWGAFSELGWGTSTQRRSFSHGVSLEYNHGDLYPLEHLSEKCESDLAMAGPMRPLLILHTTGKSVGSPLSKKHWRGIVGQLKERFVIAQVGGKGDKKIKGCHFSLLGASIEELIAWHAKADFFIGPNSGFMHIAAAFNIKSLVLVHEIPAAEIMLPALADNILLPKEINDHLFHLYPQNMHLHVNDDTNELYPKFTAENLDKAVEGGLFHWPDGRSINGQFFDGLDG